MSAATAVTEKKLAEFAAHTRHADHEKANTTQIARKWLALHVTAAPVKLIYNFVGDDFELLELRTHTPPLNTYQRSSMDPATFVYLMKNGYKNDPVHQDILPLAHFKDTLFPKPVGEEAWVAYQNDNHWKPRAYFMATKCNSGKDLYPLVKAIYNVEKVGAGEETLTKKDGAADMYTKILRYIADYAWLKVDAADMGTLINEMNLPPIININLETVPLEKVTSAGGDGTNKDEMEKVDEEIRPPLIETKLIFTPFTPPTTTLDDIRLNPVVQDYRKQACLNATFPVQKLVKQMVLSSIGAPLQKEVCAKSQQAFAQVPKEVVGKMLENAIEALDGEKIVAALDVNAQSVKDFVNLHYKLGEPIEARGFLKRILSVYSSPATENEMLATKRYLKKYPVPDEALIKCILAL